VAPQATTAIGMQYNLDSRGSIKLPATAPLVDFNDAQTYNDAKSQTVFDAKGQPITLTYYFQRTSASTVANPTAPDEWNMYVTANGATVLGTDAAPEPIATITFAADGSVPTASTLGVVDPNTGLLSFNFDSVVATGVQGGPIADGDNDATNNPLPLPLLGLEMTMDLSQIAGPFSLTDLSQDGFSAGQLVSMGIEENGIVTARYSNGQTKTAGQIEIANFRNLQGLQPVGDNMWADTYMSGDPIRGVPGDGNLGVLQSGALEESSIDLTAELVNMITAQRAYQANAQTIKTQDQVLQTLVNLR
jgi:flagellar hook protein FlgE